MGMTPGEPKARGQRKTKCGAPERTGKGQKTQVVVRMIGGGDARERAPWCVGGLLRLLQAHGGKGRRIETIPAQEERTPQSVA
mmetsp:Transcript_829/g.1309  ORF Transcript_829/g.1309 Transcript_829/m.1309 type:complete len:83 (-) Transcript_829:51-299(-)